MYYQSSGCLSGLYILLEDEASVTVISCDKHTGGKNIAWFVKADKHCVVCYLKLTVLSVVVAVIMSDLA
jgi:hypothetical protein